MKRISLIVAGLALLCGISDAVSYIRWGRTKCPTGAQPLYKGFMVGPHYAGGGDGVNFLCAPENPVFVNGKPGFQGSGAIWGVELEDLAQFPRLFKGDNVPGGTLYNQDMPCVRCYVSGDTDVWMVPGRNDCVNSGYNLQYNGFLVSEINTGARHRSEYVCLDEAPEGIQGGTGNNDQAVLYPVEFACGSLPCNPYVEGMEATCAVCTY